MFAWGSRMRTERIDPEVIGVATDALLGVLGDTLDRVPSTEIEIAAEAAICAAGEKRRELADPAAELMAVIELLAGYLADPSDERKCDCCGEGLDYEGSEWTLCECVLKKVEAPADPEGQEYAYRMVWEKSGRTGTCPPTDEAEAHKFAAEYPKVFPGGSPRAWVERALLGDWERV
jgi:hypothetical protein